MNSGGTILRMPENAKNILEKRIVEKTGASLSHRGPTNSDASNSPHRNKANAYICHAMGKSTSLSFMEISQQERAQSDQKALINQEGLHVVF